MTTLGFILLASISTLTAFAEGSTGQKYYRFNYKNNLTVAVPANDFFEARTKATKECFRILTKGVYQGEEESLDIIDVCANPVVK